MLNNITWYQFILYSFSLIGIYYAYILIVYYRKDLSDIISGRKTVISSPNKKSASDTKPKKEIESEAVEKLFTSAMELSEAIKTIFQEALYQDTGKEEIVFLLSKKIQQYSQLKRTPFMIAINNLIRTQADKYQIIIDAAAIDSLWAKGDS